MLIGVYIGVKAAAVFGCLSVYWFFVVTFTKGNTGKFYGIFMNFFIVLHDHMVST